ncbi:BrnT family toxin [Roseovarius sp.]|uniref:BrnT family toxin n=1 Tax=Roseovarius sp. TaxID=1486281 RepID=UPI003A969AE6
MFEWDADKEAINIEKHGVSFATASRIFEGFILSVIDDRFDYGEVRKNTIGLIDGVLFLTVTHTDRDGKTRIISARPAKRGERNRYDEALRKRVDHRATGRTSGQ